MSIMFDVIILCFCLFKSNVSAETKFVNVSGTVGQRVVLPCYTSKPSAVDWWYQKTTSVKARQVCLNGEVVFEQRPRMEITPRQGNYDLTIHNVTMDDAGLYTCIEEVGMGPGRFVVQLSIQPPAIPASESPSPSHSSTVEDFKTTLVSPDNPQEGNGSNVVIIVAVILAVVCVVMASTIVAAVCLYRSHHCNTCLHKTNKDSNSAELNIEKAERLLTPTDDTTRPERLEGDGLEMQTTSDKQKGPTVDQQTASVCEKILPSECNQTVTIEPQDVKETETTSNQQKDTPVDQYTVPVCEKNYSSKTVTVEPRGRRLHDDVKTTTKGGIGNAGLVNRYLRQSQAERENERPRNDKY